MSRFIYTLLFSLAQPLIWLRLLWRARKQPEYLQHIGERYGHYPNRTPRPLLWLHAVSVGETRAAEPLIQALLAEFPQHTLLLTHMTPTGRAVGVELIAKLGPRLLQATLPYDLPGACQRFLAHFQPELGLLMETELWPNLINAAKRLNIPIALINARLSEKSLRGYQRILPLVRPALESLSAVAAQTPADATRLQMLGAKITRVTGNLKFDVAPSEEKLEFGLSWRQALKERPVWLVASTREGEEALILEAFQKLNHPELLLLMVPRHPQRFDEVAAHIAERGFTFIRRSNGNLPGKETRVWLGDSMGEMPAYYAVADVALIGGTLLPFGGQNLIEAAACGCPVLVGPHTFNFAQASEDAITGGAARRITDANGAAVEVACLLKDQAALQAMRDAALRFSQAHRGATARTITLIREVISAIRAE